MAATSEKYAVHEIRQIWSTQDNILVSATNGEQFIKQRPGLFSRYIKFRHIK